MSSMITKTDSMLFLSKILETSLCVAGGRLLAEGVNDFGIGEVCCREVEELLADVAGSPMV